MKKLRDKLTFINKINTFFVTIISCLNFLLPFFLFTENKPLFKQNPFLHIMRLHALTGIWLSLMPALWVVVAEGRNAIQIIYFTVLFTLGAILVRSAGCVINDILDRRFDVDVERTKHRPLATGAISLQSAWILFAVLALLSFFLLLLLPFKAMKVALITAIMVCVYPLFKRFSKLPQFFLGLVFNMGIWIAYFALGKGFSLNGLCLYFAAVFWTVGYDTIYAFLDKEHDLKLGIWSTAITFGDYSVDMIWKLYRLQAMLLLAFGFYMNYNLFYFLLIVAALYHLYWQVSTIKLDDKEGIMLRFKSNIITSFIILGAIIVGRI